MGNIPEGRCSPGRTFARPPDGGWLSCRKSVDRALSSHLQLDARCAVALRIPQFDGHKCRPCAVFGREAEGIQEGQWAGGAEEFAEGAVLVDGGDETVGGVDQ